MRTELYWVPGPWPGRLAVMPRPRGGDWLEDEVRSWKRSGIDVVLSLLTPDEVTELGLAEEETLCRANDIELLSLPIPDRSIPPSQEEASAVVTKLADRLADGKGVAVHCRQGVGRAGLIAAGLLVAAGTDPETALQGVSAARGCTVPETPEQRRWVADFAESLLTRSPK